MATSEDLSSGPSAHSTPLHGSGWQREWSTHDHLEYSGCVNGTGPAPSAAGGCNYTWACCISYLNNRLLQYEIAHDKVGSLIGANSSFYSSSASCSGGFGSGVVGHPAAFGSSRLVFEIVSVLLTQIAYVALFKFAVDAAVEKKWCLKSAHVIVRIAVAAACILAQLVLVVYWWETIKVAQVALGLANETDVPAQREILTNVAWQLLFVAPFFDWIKRMLCRKREGSSDALGTPMLGRPRLSPSFAGRE